MLRISRQIFQFLPFPGNMRTDRRHRHLGSSTRDQGGEDNPEQLLRIWVISAVATNSRCAWRSSDGSMVRMPVRGFTHQSRLYGSAMFSSGETWRTESVREVVSVRGAISVGFLPVFWPPKGPAQCFESIACHPQPIPPCSLA